MPVNVFFHYADGKYAGRAGELTIAYPGGCTIGARPINWHLEILKEMGAVILEEGERLRAVCRKLKGCRIRLPFPSVGVTENGILAAVRAEGVTVLQGCAREPEIVHLCRFLQKMGVAVEGAGTSCIRIEGGGSLQSVRFEIPRDRIAAGTYLYAGAATRGYVELEGAPVDEMGAILEVYKKMGGQYTANGVTLKANSALVRHPLRGIQTARLSRFPHRYAVAASGGTVHCAGGAARSVRIYLKTDIRSFRNWKKWERE